MKHCKSCYSKLVALVLMWKWLHSTRTWHVLLSAGTKLVSVAPRIYAPAECKRTGWCYTSTCRPQRSTMASVSNRPPRNVDRRPTIVAHTSNGQERLMPLLASLAAGQDRTPAAAPDGGQQVDSSQPQPTVEGEDGQSDWCSSDEYDTDLEEISCAPSVSVGGRQAICSNKVFYS